MKGLLTFVGVCIGALSLVGQELILDKVVAKVGDEYVLLSEIEEQYSLASERQQVPEGGRCVFLENLLVTNLLVHYARIDSMEVSEEEVEVQLELRLDNILRMMNNDVEQFEEFYGMSTAQVRENFRRDVRKQMNAQSVQASITETIKVTPSEVIQYFNRIPKDSLPYFNSEVEISEIVYEVAASEQAKDEAYAEAEEVLAKLRQGDSFEDLARIHSDDGGSARLGGSLGRNARGTFVMEFEAVAYKMLQGEISEIVETEFGYHIIRLNERIGDIIDASHILIRPVITPADRDSAKHFLLDLRDRIEVGEIDFVSAVRQHSDENTQSYANGGRIFNPETGNTFWETVALKPPDVFFAIDTLDLGEVSGPVEFRLPSGDVIYKILQLNSRTPPHRASLDRDYTKILNAARQSKQNEAFNEWVDRKIKETYILVDTAFDGCPNLEKWNIQDIRP